jgi:acetyl esterase/lipase
MLESWFLNVAIFFALIPLLLTLIGLALSIWSVVPAPNMTLLPLSVGAPEICIWLLGFSAIGLLSYGVFQQLELPAVLRWLGIGLSVTCITLNAHPLLQLSGTIAEADRSMDQALGNNYLATIPLTVRATFKSEPFSLLTALRGINSPPIRSQRQIQFANDPSLTLNFYHPITPGQYPGVIQIYGGAWRSGSPDHDEEFSRYLASRGYVVVSIDYRHAPQHRFPAQLDDSRQVMRDFLGGTPTKLPELYQQASPGQLVNRRLPPTLLIYGGKDHLVESRFGRKLAKNLQSFDTPTVFIEIPWANHAFDVIFNGTSNQLALYYTERFLARCLYY